MIRHFWKPLPWAKEQDIRVLTGVVGRTFVWSLIGTLCFIRYWVQATRDGLHAGFWPDIFVWMACFYPWVFLAPLIFRLEIRLPLSWKARDARNLIILVLAGGLFSYAAFVMRILLTALFQFIVGQQVDAFPRPWAISSEEFFYHQIPYGLTVGAACLLRTLSQLRGREREAARLELEKSRLESSLRLAELEALRMRLNPHFLFNTLQNISVLAQKDPPTASVMLTRLGDLLRASFRKDFQQEIPLEAEIELTQAYLDVERMRFQDRLSVAVEVEPGIQDALVPTFLLQPLVENALQHGLSGPRPGNIRICGSKQDDWLVLTVEDNGAGLPAENLRDLQLGVGLGATCDRLQRLYFDRQELAIRNLADGGTEVRISLPFRLNAAAV
jgi:two-component system, LytTR family, sensor kinase